MGTFLIETPDPEGTQRVGRALALELQPGDCVALSGDLGAGKTCLVRGLAQGLGCDAAQVHSPTFTVMHRYRGSLCDLVHVDAYRVGGAEELRDAGLDADGTRDAVLAVEWPDRILGGLTGRCIEVTLAVTGETSRSIRVTDTAGTVAERLAAALGPKPCPSCAAAVGPFDADWPFCSARCRAADLGRWFSGKYQISRPIEQTDLESGLD